MFGPGLALIGFCILTREARGDVLPVVDALPIGRPVHHGLQNHLSSNNRENHVHRHICTYKLTFNEIL